MRLLLIQKKNPVSEGLFQEISWDSPFLYGIIIGGAIVEWMEMKGSRLVVSLPAELDHHYTEDIRTEIDRAVSNQPVDEVEFDFTRTIFMDSAGIGMLIGRYKIMRALNGRIILSHMNRQIQRILSLSGIQRYIQLDGEEAV